MRVVLTDEAALEIDLELPFECWSLDDLDLDERMAWLLRMAYVKGYTDATKDAKRGRLGQLLLRLARVQQATISGPS